MKSKSVKMNAKMIRDEFVQDGEMFVDVDEFLEEMSGIKKKKMEKKVEEEEGKMEKEEVKIEEEVKEVERKIIEEEKMEVKEEMKEEKNGMNFDNKYKGRRERDEDSREYGIYKKNTVSKYFENACELLANDKSTLSEIFQEFSSMFARCYKSLERIVYEQDRLKKRPLSEVTWIYDPSGMGEIEWADKYLAPNDSFYKVSN
jgi:hypothetical protein